jgi:hypothetical protein
MQYLTGEQEVQVTAEYARRWHDLDTKPYGGEPYITHPLAVADWLCENGYGYGAQASANLHDVVEDTRVEFADLYAFTYEGLYLRRPVIRTVEATTFTPRDHAHVEELYVSQGADSVSRSEIIRRIKMEKALAYGPAKDVKTGDSICNLRAGLTGNPKARRHGESLGHYRDRRWRGASQYVLNVLDLGELYGPGIVDGYYDGQLDDSEDYGRLQQLKAGRFSDEILRPQRKLDRDEVRHYVGEWLGPACVQALDQINVSSGEAPGHMKRAA